MPTIQVSQIVLRAGPSIDLPGVPSSINPLTFTQGLLPGEMAFMTDTGIIYVGHEPTSGQAQFDRAAFPYRNIEVLTENSVPTLNRVIGNATKEEGDFAYHDVLLPTHTSDWENVVLPRTGDETYAYRLPYTEYVAAVIDYVCYTETGNPVKVGQLQVRYFEGEPEPNLVDEASVMRRLDIIGADANIATAVYQQVDFRFIVDGPVGGRYLTFQYKNRTTSMVSLSFKVSRPKV